MDKSLGERAADFFRTLLDKGERALNETLDETIGGVVAERVEARTGINPTFLAVGIAVLLTWLIVRR